MKKPIKIGPTEYSSKKEALAYYKSILNSYDFGQTLKESDFDQILDLLEYGNFYDNDESNFLVESSFEPIKQNQLMIDFGPSEDIEFFIESIKVARVQFNTKCFEVYYSDKTSQYISYLMLLNHTRHTAESLFYTACRSSIHLDIRSVKQSYFDNNSVNGQAKCQETGILSKWAELVVDHRQPNTFSMIVDRFKEVKGFNLDTVKYTSSPENHIIFQNFDLIEQFKMYHK